MWLQLQLETMNLSTLLKTAETLLLSVVKAQGYICKNVMFWVVLIWVILCAFLGAKVLKGQCLVSITVIHKAMLKKMYFFLDLDLRWTSKDGFRCTLSHVLLDCSESSHVCHFCYRPRSRCLARPWKKSCLPIIQVRGMTQINAADRICY